MPFAATVAGPGRQSAFAQDPPLRFARDARVRQRWVEDLAQLVALPTVSSSPARRGDMIRACQWLSRRLRRAGIRDVEVLAAGDGPPSVFGRLAGRSGAPTVLLYGHYDVQPAGDRSRWRLDPFQPRIRHGYLYGRGASDDKGQLLTHVNALEALNATGPLPVNVKVWIEGEEEIGSPNIDALLRREGDRLSADALVVSDTQMLGANQPTIVVGLRGLLATEVTVFGPKHDLHDGLFGGAAPNPIHSLGRLIGSLHDEQCRIAVPGAYSSIRPIAAAERSAMRCLLASDSQLARAIGAAPVGEPGWSAKERTLFRPALNVTTIRSGAATLRPSSVVPAVAAARLNLRLVPDQQPDVLQRALEQHLATAAGPEVRWRLRRLAAVNPVVAEGDSPLLHAAHHALHRAFGSEPSQIRTGGTIPAVSALRKCFGMPVALIGFGLPGDNPHAPNERFLLANFHRGTEAIIHLLLELGR